MRLTAFFHPLATLASVTMLAALTLAGCGGTTPARPDAGTQPPLSSSAPPIRIGIALGGGAAKGFAHIGVIKMLEANGFAPAVVSGTSAGSVVGALIIQSLTYAIYSLGVPPEINLVVKAIVVFVVMLLQSPEFRASVGAMARRRPAATGVSA